MGEFRKFSSRLSENENLDAIGNGGLSALGGKRETEVFGFGFVCNGRKKAPDIKRYKVQAILQY